MGKHAETLDFVDYYAVLAALTCCSPSAVAMDMNGNLLDLTITDGPNRIEAVDCNYR